MKSLPGKNNIRHEPLARAGCNEVLLQRVDGCAHLLRHRRRQRRIVERGGLVLMLQHPLEKIDQDFPVGRSPWQDWESEAR